MNSIFKVVAGSTLGVLLLPTLAFAHEGVVKGDVGVLGVRIEKALDKIEKKGEHMDRKEHRLMAHATTTAAAIGKQALRIQAAAESMLSFEGRVSALIASSSAEGKAALEAKFAAFKSAATSAKLEAGSAIVGSAAVSATNSTTTNASLLAQAKIDLREARNFLHEAKVALLSIFRSLWK